jgi:hypothetical protein
MEPDETTRLLKDLVWLNAVIATELIQITENTSAILRHGEIPESCRIEHRSLREESLAIAERVRPGTMLAQHLSSHQ